MTFKQEVVASQGVVASNHPLASAAGLEMLVQGGNAVDAAIATLFTLTVVEPMMVTPFGAGFIVLRDGRTGEVITIDNYATAPLAAHETLFTPVVGGEYYEAEGRANEIGYLAVGVPGALLAWEQALMHHGTMALADVLQPAIRYARRGFEATPYLVQAIHETRPHLARFPASAETFLPGGEPPRPGDRLVRADYGRTLQQIAEGGAAVLYDGPLGAAVARDMEQNGGLISEGDLKAYQTKLRPPVRGTYHGFEVVSMGPVSSGGTHIVQMLNLVEGDDLRSLGHGSVAYYHLLAEVMKIAFADRALHMGDPDREPVPVAHLIDKAYGRRRREEISSARAQSYGAGFARLHGESRNTTHVTVIDATGTLVSTTQTAQGLFGSCVTTPGTGMILNNCLHLFDPAPGQANSVAPGKRMLSSMSPTLVLKDREPFMALGTPGAKRIFPAVWQAILNVIDHHMSLQQAVEAPRIWTMGDELEVEEDVPEEVRRGLANLGHKVVAVPKVAGGMNGVLIDPRTGLLHGAACWRADGAPVGYSGGLARPSLTTL